MTVTELIPPSRMVWSRGMPLGLFRGRRALTLTPVGDAVRHEMREERTELLAPVIGRSLPDLQPAFDAFGASLEQRAERES